MLLFHITIAMSLPQLLLTKSVSGTQRTDKNYSEFKCQVYNVSVYHSCKMANRSFQVGQMEKFVHFYLNLANCYMWLMMHIITDARLWLRLPMERESFQEVLKDKFVYGKSLNKLNLWSHPLKNIEVGYGPFKSVRTIHRLSAPVVMDPVLFGISKVDIDCFAYFSLLLSNKLYWTPNSIRFWLLAQTER